MFDQISLEQREAPSAQRATNPEALRHAHRLLLERTVLTRTRNAEEYRLVARQVDALAYWHQEHTGWPIYANEHAGVIRLRRRFGVVPSGAWEPWRSEVEFSSPRDYACLVYLLWYARGPLVLARGTVRQALLSELQNHLAQRSQLASEANAGLELIGEPFDFVRRRSDYYSLRRAIKALQQLGAANILDEVTLPGTTEGEGVEALIEFTDVVEALIVELNPRLVQLAAERRPDAFSLDAPAVAEENLTPLTRAWRALLLGPLLLPRDDPAAYAALVRHQHLVEPEIERSFGYAMDLTPHYARLVRPGGTALDHTPALLNHQQRGIVQAALLLCAELRQRVAAAELSRPESDGCLFLTREDLLKVFRDVCAVHQPAWGSDLAGRKPENILDHVCDVLRVAGFLRGPNASNALLVLPTAALYRVEYPEAPRKPEAAESAQFDLFGATATLGQTTDPGVANHV